MENEHQKAEAEPLTKYWILPSFAAIKAPQWGKVKVGGIAEVAEAVARHFLTKACPQIKLFGIHRSRDSNTNSNFGFAYVQGLQEFAQLLAIKDLTTPSGKKITFEVAKPKEKKPDQTKALAPRGRGNGRV